MILRISQATLLLGIILLFAIVLCDESVESQQRSDVESLSESGEEGEELLADDPRSAAYRRPPQRTYDRVIRPGYGQRSSQPCEQRSCYPATGNLLIGRQNRLSATSTCGLREKEKYCIVSHLRERKKCFWCRSTETFIGNPRYEHRIPNIIYRFDPRTKQRSWYQSENGKQDVSIRIDLEAEFHFTHLIMTFRTFRPAAMLIERSWDFGKTWKVYRYFAYDCADSFPGVRAGPPQTVKDVVCESRYSAVEPSTEGEVIFRVLPPNIRIDNPYSDEVQNLLKITNLRVNFTKLHTLGDELLDQRVDIKEKYYYAIYDMVVRGSCSCYGHASRCLPLPDITEYPSMVHGRCECTHNTQGLNCEKCLDFYHDLPWRPAVGKESNACKKCNCNSHAEKCHFDPKVYEETGKISGGVCDGCAHNTMGRNCESCLPYFYQDPLRDIRDPDICQPCDCYVPGSIDDAICDSYSDSAAGLEAGRCHCKANVDGWKCDRCKAGFWNFTEENPEGCQACTCNTLGTLNNQGCNVYTGECQCKRNVMGRDCNQCVREHYGLSDHPDGCQPCDCDVGGTIDNNGIPDNSCDVITGQCKCRPYVTGLRCDRPEEGYYVGSLNYLTYEGESTRGSENVQVMMRESYTDGRGISWTGPGFMRVYEDSFLEFDIENIQTSMDYDMIIRYEPNFRGSWNDIKVTIERLDGEVDPNGACSNARPIDDQVFVTFPEYQQQVKVFPPVCLEKNKRYKVRLDFSRSNPAYDSASAYILIDAIKLIPRAERLPFYSGSLINDNRREEYERYRCTDPFYENNDLDRLPEICKKDHLDSVGFYVYKQAFACECDGTGSKSSICSAYGGQCDCKPNVVGRRCDRCAPGTYNFGPEGCQPCECSNVGSLDNFCDLISGQCKCRPNTYGRACNECQPGFWNFPNCQRCECNGMADTCESITGVCDDCRDYTMGKNCQYCVEGYYGDPRLDVGIPCRQCPCPGTLDSGHSFAQRCFLDSFTKDVVCECDAGYAGARCDACSDNYYGNPETPGGSCEPCNCNSNVDISRPGNCDSNTGECLQCLFYTGGFNCERCKAGFYGDALNKQCRECQCNILGTNQTAGSCDHETGQCFCLPNVEGLECDRCAAKHWKIASGLGCEPCDCDPIGATSDQCNEYTGLCDCRFGFGGRKCDQCEANYWGNPQVECLSCDCDWQGSESQQCDHETGQCQCLPGIGGYKCNECARGFTGRAPWCEPCGECFDNWEIIIEDLIDRTGALIGAASQIKQRGAAGAYSSEFDNMEETLYKIEEIIKSSNLSSQNVVSLELALKQLSDNFTTAEDYVEALDDEVDETTQRTELANNALSTLQKEADKLRNQAEDLRKQATDIQEGNAEGALALTSLAQDRSWEAQKRIQETDEVIVISDRNRRRIENLLNNYGDKFNITQDTNEMEITELNISLANMDTLIPGLNEKVCDHRGDPCDKFCGGAGCNKCGGLSCNDGLVETAKLAEKFSNDAEKALKEKETAADELLRKVSRASRASKKGADIAKIAFDLTFEARNITTDHIRNMDELIFNISEFFENPGGSPTEIIELTKDVLGLKISLQPEQITDLAAKITQTIISLRNIDAILDETRADVLTTEDLKERAVRAKAAAVATLEVAELVTDALIEAANAQQSAEQSLQQATQDISATETHLTQIASETQAAQEKSNSSLSEVSRLVEDVDTVKEEFQVNKQYLEDSKTAVAESVDKAQAAVNESITLDADYHEVDSKLTARVEQTKRIQEQADSLKYRADQLKFEVTPKLNELQEMELAFERNQQHLEDFEEEIRRLETLMEEYQIFIDNKLVFYATCSG